ncbi:MAG TPA: hypothetical protein VFZ21_22480 [Gemmatimonadaceae bacterium]|nr:hypothetical protein [Gemmatimonadaceae bacterium]
MASVIAGSAERAHAMPASVPGTRVSDSVRHVMPGARWTLAVPLTNPSGTAVTFHVRVLVPAGWRVGTAPTSVSVPARGRDLAFIPLSVGLTVPPGEGAVRYVVESAAGAARRDSVPYVVGERHELTLTGEAPEFAATGGSYAARFIVENRGNDARSYDVGFVSAVPATLEGAASRRIAAGGTDTVTVVVRLPSELPLTTSTVTVKLKPTVASGSDRLTTFVQTSVFATSGGDAWARLPLQLTPTAGSSGGTLAIEGRGVLADERTRLDLVLRGPRRPAAIAGASDEYRLALTSTRWRLQLGDQAVKLTPLTENGRGATGASAAFTGQRWSASLGSVITRQYGEATHLAEQFGSIGVRLPGGLRMQGTALRRAGRADSGAVGGVQLTWTPGARQVVEVEGNRAERGGRAWRARMGSTMGRLRLQGSVLAADTAFPGYAKGTRSADGSGRLQLSRSLWIRAGGEDRLTTGGLLFGRDVANPDTLVAHEPLTQHRYRNAVAAIGWNRVLQVEARSRRRDDPTGALVWGAERSLAVSSALGPRWLQLSPRVEVGEVTSAHAATPLPMQRASLDVRIALGHFGAFSPWAGVDVGRSMYDTTARRSWNAGAQLELHAAGTRAIIGGQYGLSMIAGPWTPPVPTRRADATIVHELRSGDELRARVRWDPQARALVGSDVRVEVGYALHVGVPVGRPRRGGWVRGRLREEKGGAGTGGAMVRLDERLAMTDRHGNFQFSAVPAGVHVVSVDAHSLGAGRMVRDSALRTVRVEDGRGTGVDLVVVAGGRVAGRVIWYDDGPQQVLAAGAAAAGAPVQRDTQLPVLRLMISSTARTVLATSDATGRFSADGLEPGTWTVQPEPGALPATHRPASGEVRILVPAGGVASAELRVVPRPRTVHLLTTGEPPAPVTKSPAPRTVTPPRKSTTHGRRDVPLQPEAPRRRPVVRDVPLLPDSVTHPVCPWPVVRPNGPICQEPVVPDSTVVVPKP